MEILDNPWLVQLGFSQALDDLNRILRVIVYTARHEPHHHEGNGKDDEQGDTHRHKPAEDISSQTTLSLVLFCAHSALGCSLRAL